MRHVRFARLLTFVLLLPELVWAQAGTTSLRGTITDSTGALVAGADVKLSNAATAFLRAAKTDSSGEYQFVQVPPATYTLSATAPGFSTAKAENLALQVNTPTTINLTLKARGQDTVVEVASTAPLVNTTDASVGNAFNSDQLINLPSEGRDPVAILSLQPGVVYLGNNVKQARVEFGTGFVADSRGGAVAGGRSDQANITLDGLDNNDQVQGLAFEGALRTTLDSLQEFRVTTTNANADQGRSSGAQVNLVTKSGTNRFHGSLYEYHRPTITAANDWFNKQAQLRAGEPNLPGRIIRNTFGGSVGGPIIKDRLFFFAAYEGMRRAESAQITRTIPSDELRQGMLQYVCDATDPACTTANPQVRTVPGLGLVVTLTPADIAAMDQGCLTSNGGVGSCPLGPGPNSGVLTYWNSYPSPNSDTLGDLLNFRGFTAAVPNPRKQDTYILKLDYRPTSNGNHTLFVRGNLQNDRELKPPQFPGLHANEFDTNNSKGIAAGYTAVLGVNLVNNFRYAFVRQGYGFQGITTGDAVIDFLGLDEPHPIRNRSTLVNVPVHNLSNDTTWTTGKHTLQFGTNWRFIHNHRRSDANNYSSAWTAVAGLVPVAIAGTGTDLDPGAFGFPTVDANFKSSYDFAAVALTGLMTIGFINYSQDKTGTILPNGTLIPRSFQSYEAEFYLQDTWRIKPSLTLTGGVRYTLLQPVYESMGNQVCPTFSLHDWFARRGEAALQGITDSPTISLDLCGNANDRRSYWGWDYKDVAPRVAFAWSPSSSNRILKTLFGQGGSGSLRGGYGLYYDHFGQGVANTFDAHGSFGLTTLLIDPTGLQDVDCAARFSAPGVIPTGTFCGQNVPPPPPGAFPVTPPTGFNPGSFAVYWGLDDALKTPYAHVFNLTYTRELPGKLVISATYQGRLGRRLLQEADLAQPLDLVDPTSGADYFAAATQLAVAAENGADINTLAPIPYWENLFPAAAGAQAAGLFLGGSSSCSAGAYPAAPTATQAIYELYSCFPHNETTALVFLDLVCFPACAGPTGSNRFSFFDDQFASLYAWRSQGNSSYHGLQLTVRRPMSKGLQFDVNYTFSKSIDVGSNAERISEYFEGIGFYSQAINAWQPNQLRAPSDYDLRHQINADWIYELPVGRGRRWGTGWSRGVEAFLGGWQVSGLFRWTSGFPFSVAKCLCFATNWTLTGTSVRTGNPGAVGTFIDANGDPNIFRDPAQAFNALRALHPGESGQRNNLRGPGYFAIDTAVAKRWKFGEDKSLQFSWETFNLTNTVRFDAAQATNLFHIGGSTSFGKYFSTLTRPRAMQFALRFTF